jgi:hypothetical protein
MEITEQIKTLTLPAFRELFTRKNGRKPTALEEASFKQAKKKHVSSADKTDNWRRSHRDTDTLVWEYSGDDFQKVDFNDTPLWLSTYLNEAFPIPFGKVHLDIIADYKSALATWQRLRLVVVARQR